MKLISNMKISTRLIASFIIVSVIAGGIGFIGILNIQKIDHLDTELYQKITVPLSEMVFITDSFQRMRGNVKDVVLSGNASEIADYEQRIQERNLEFNEYLGSFKKTLLTDAGKQVIADLEASKAKYDDIANRIIQLSKEGRTAEALTVLRQDENAVRQEMEEAISVVTGMKIDLAEETATSNTSTAKASTVMMTVLLAAGVIISILLGLGISYSINKPVKKLMAAADQIAKGDLSVDIDASAKDEIGILAQSFKQMTDSISEVMLNINISAAEVAAGSRQLADSSVGLSHGATEQASSIEELNASINDIANQQTRMPPMRLRQMIWLFPQKQTLMREICI